MKSKNDLPDVVKTFLQELSSQNFRGDIETRLSERLVSATDNSIYQILPQAVLHPRDQSDVELILRLLAREAYKSIKVTPRGGGTGTNGQSLTDGIVVDLSRHMNQILEFDEKTRTVRVQTGVVKDQLNAYLRPLGYFFAPELSTSNRATIGGMINTDASGQGSCAYGKTSGHVNGITAILRGGAVIESESITLDELSSLPEISVKKALLNDLREITLPHKEAIDQCFPKLNRYVTGYDLDHFVHDEQANLTHILCGSEGTLGIFTEARLNVLPIPKKTALALVTFDDFIKALEDGPYLMQANATSIEVIDDIVLEMAKNDFVWSTTEEYFEGVDYEKLKAIFLVEFNADTDEELQQALDQFVEHANQKPNPHRLSIRPLLGKKAVKDVYGLRKRAVGLLGAIPGDRRPIPFVEDTAVPPENLAPYIAEFKAILEAHDLRYGMFGHADAGVIHVRPALDMHDLNDQPLIREISDQIFALCEKYGGALWGEHGKGVRSEYSKPFFGELYPVVQAVKRLFDPYNQFNPGKIATPNDEILLKIDELPLRGDFNREILPEHVIQYHNTLHCNGNGACYNYDTDAAMCPSYKATRERVHSPKGRAEMIKEWLRQRAIGEVDRDFEEEIYDSLSICLSCKSCTGECPAKVHIPDAKSEFLAEYHKTRPRPMLDKVLAESEDLAPFAYKMRHLSNNAIARFTMEKMGLVDLPNPKTNHLNRFEREKKVVELTHGTLDQLAHVKNPEKALIIVPDAFFLYYDPDTLKAAIELLNKLDVTVFIAPYQASGKVHHVFGFSDELQDRASKQNALLTKLTRYNIPMVGIEPPITLFYQQEYRKKFKFETPEVMLFQTWLEHYLSDHLDTLNLTIRPSNKTYKLMSHCTEKTNATSAPKAWESIFKSLDHKLEMTQVGCCGMSGSFGHLKDKKPLSKKIYDLSWKKVIDANDADVLLATGFSCRSQVERFGNKTIVHPIVKLNEMIR